LSSMSGTPFPLTRNQKELDFEQLLARTFRKQRRRRNGHGRICLVTLPELLDECARLGVKLWTHGGSLRVRAPKGIVTPALRAALEAHKGGS
jgi:hypothetical protein